MSKENVLLLAQNENASIESYFEENVEEKDSEKDKKKKKKKDDAKDDIRIDTKFLISIILNILALFIILRLIYLPNYGNKDFMFTFFLFNIVVFLLTYLLNHIKISMGAAFGLFAIFSMLRYRTEDISTKDMTYLFVVIAIGLIGAIKLEYYEQAAIYGIIILSVFALDGNILMRREYSKVITYENIDLIQPDKREQLISDLRNRTGLNIHRISITKIDFLQDAAIIRVYYYE
jgi:cation transport ATPase